MLRFPDTVDSDLPEWVAFTRLEDLPRRLAEPFERDRLSRVDVICFPLFEPNQDAMSGIKRLRSEFPTSSASDEPGVSPLLVGLIERPLDRPESDDREARVDQLAREFGVILCDIRRENLVADVDDNRIDVEKVTRWVDRRLSHGSVEGHVAPSPSTKDLSEPFRRQPAHSEPFDEARFSEEMRKLNDLEWWELDY